MTHLAPDDPERALALSYAAAAARPALMALFALDDTLARILRRTRDPLVGQMRLTWWHEALTRLDTADAPAEPVLQALARAVLPRGVRGDALAGMIDGWEALLDTPLDEAALRRHGERRGARLFELAGAVVGAGGDPVAVAGQGWALADLSWHLSDRIAADVCRRLARPALIAATGRRWSRAGRALGALAHLARMDLSEPFGAPRPTGAPARVARLMVHRLTGQ